MLVVFVLSTTVPGYKVSEHMYYRLYKCCRSGLGVPKMEDHKLKQQGFSAALADSYFLRGILGISLKH